MRTFSSGVVDIAVASVPGSNVSPPDTEFCELCREHVSVSVWENHGTHPDHVRRVKLRLLQMTLDNAGRDKNGITIERTDDFGIISPTAAAVGNRMLDLKIRSTTSAARVSIVSAHFASQKGRRDRAPP